MAMQFYGIIINTDLPSEICTAVGFDERMLLHSEVKLFN